MRSDGALVLATVVATKGSAPRRAGTKMLISDSQFVGTIGGGNLEYQVTSQARKLLEADGPGYLLQHYALGPLLEQCCGGTVDVMLERLDENNTAFLSQPETGYLETSYHDDGFVKSWLGDNAPDGVDCSPFAFFDSENQLTDDVKCLVVIIEQHEREKRPLYIFGAGHVGRAVVRALAPLAFDIVWIDSRMAEFPSDVPANSSIQVTEDYSSYVDAAPSDACFLVFTHSHQRDYEVIAKILARGDAAFCGLIGSATKRARFEKRLVQEGLVVEADLLGLTCPIGLADIEGNEPAIIAASVAAQLLGLRK
ncbi:MAG: xanthine dehydrogenase accessory protein XdhC [Kordiimonadaceae bacterium]|nr:xanthine dehydrogenase accessory protein XdhC [Kordiimonadaceae bacterium]